MMIEERIKEFVSKSILFSDSAFSYSDDASFLQEGILDSIGVMELVTFAGTAFGISVSPDEVTPANFDSISKLAAYIRHKLSASPRSEESSQ